MTITKQLLATAMLVCMTCATAFGQTTLYWTGNADTDWNDPNNWSTSPGGTTASVPTSSDIAIFADSADNHCILDANASVAELLVSATSNKNLDLNGHNLAVAGDFTQHTAIFQGGNGTISIGGLLHIIGGEFHATTGTTSVADGIIEEGSYFSPHGGKVSITGTGATIDMATFLYDLEIATGASAELANSIQVANNLDLDGPIDADVNAIVLGNDSPSAITGSSGVYFSIGAGPIGLFIWLIGENTGTYTLPFLATTSGPVVPVEVDITTAGDGPDGFLLFSCLETDDTKPQDIFGDGIGFYDATGGNNADYNINRLWLMIASDYTESPVFDLELSYTTADLSGISVTEANLKAQAYDELHWGELLGTVNTTANTLAVTGYTLPTDDRANFVALVDNTSPNMSTYGGETGLTCADAIELDSIDIETVFEMVDTAMWFKFIAKTWGAVYNTIKADTAILNVDSVLLYKDPCVSPIWISSATDEYGFGNILLMSSDLIEDSVYYLKLRQPYATISHYRIIEKTSVGLEDLGSTFNDSMDFFDVEDITNKYFEINECNVDEEDGENIRYLRWHRYWKNRVNNQGKFYPYFDNLNDIINSQNGYCTESSPIWKCLGPFEDAVNATKQNLGRIIGIGVDPTDMDKILVSSSGGIFKSINGGSTWTNTTMDEGYSYFQFKHILFHPTDNNTVYAGSGTGSNGPYGRYSGLPDEYGVGIIQSKDGGENWEPTGLTYDPVKRYAIRKLVISPASTSTITILFAIVHNENGSELVRCIGDPENASHWSVLTNLPNIQGVNGNPASEFLDIEIDKDDNIWVGAREGVYRSSNLGISWQLIQNFGSITLPNNVLGNCQGYNGQQDWVDGMHINATSTGVYVKAQFYSCNARDTNNIMWKPYYVFKSEDNGATWTYLFKKDNEPYGLFKVSPVQENIMYFALRQGDSLRRSIDSGVTDTFITDDPTIGDHVDVRVVNIYKPSPAGDIDGNEEIIFIGNDGGILRTNGVNGDKLALNGYGLHMLASWGLGGTEQNHKVIYTGNIDGNSNKFNDGIWYSTSVNSNDNGECLIDPLDSNIVYQQMNFRFVKTVSGSQVTSFGQSGTQTVMFPMEFHPNNSNFIYAGWKDLWLNDDQGNYNSWFNITNGSGVPDDHIISIAVSPANPDIVYIAYPEGIYSVDVSNISSPVVTDITSNLKSSSPSGPLALRNTVITDVVVDPLNEDRMFLTLSRLHDGHKVYKTENGGVSWSNYSEGLPNLPVNQIVYEEGSNDRLYIATDYGVFYRDALMSSWCYYGNLPHTIVQDLEINYCSRMLRAVTFGLGMWEAPMPPAQHNSEVVISSNTTWDTEHYLKSDLRILSGATLTIEALLRMPEDGKIIVERGAKLIVDGGHITNVCDKLWAGIEVWGNSSKKHPWRSQVWTNNYPIAYDDQGVVYLKNGALIENAKEGIVTNRTDGYYPTYWGGVIFADDATFRNCRKSVGFMQYADYTNVNYNASYFRNCTFEYDGPLNNGALFAEAMVSMWDVHGVTFTENTFINQTPSLFGIYSRGNAIYSIDATFTVSSETCNDPQTPSGCAEFSWEPNLFKDLTTGVTVIHTKSPRGINMIIRRNKFENVNVGIELRSSQFTKIYENDFNFDDGVVGRTGIYNLGSSDFTIAENRFSGDDTNFRGVYSTGTSSLRPWQYYRNQLNNSGDPWTEAFPNSYNNRQLQFRCNIINDEMGTVLVYSGGVASSQGDLTNPAGNYFDTDCYVGSSPHLWKNAAADGFNYWHFTQPNTVIPDNDCINDLAAIIKRPKFGTQQNTYCPRLFTQPDMTIGDIGSGIGEVGLAISGITNTLDGGNHWGLIGFVRDIGTNNNAATLTALNNAGMLSDKVILEVLQHRPSFDREDLAGVLLKNYPLSYWALSEVEELDPPLPIDSLNKIYQYQDSSSARGDKIDSIYALIFQKSVLYDRWMLILADDTTHTIGELRDTLAKETDPGFLALLADLYLLDSSYTNVWNILDSLPLYSKELRDWVDLRKIQLNFEQQGWNWSDLEGEGEASSFTDDLEILNSSNTTAGLQVKHIAMAFFDGDVPLIFEERDSYKKGAKDELVKTTDNHTLSSFVSMHPNPANNTVTIRYDFSETENATLRLFNLLGNLVKEVYLNNHKGEIVIDVNDYPIGTYLYKTTGTGNEVLPSGRLLIIR